MTCGSKSYAGFAGKRRLITKEPIAVQLNRKGVKRRKRVITSLNKRWGGDAHDRNTLQIMDSMLIKT